MTKDNKEPVLRERPVQPEVRLFANADELEGYISVDYMNFIFMDPTKGSFANIRGDIIYAEIHHIQTQIKYEIEEVEKDIKRYNGKNYDTSFLTNRKNALLYKYKKIEEYYLDIWQKYKQQLFEVLVKIKNEQEEKLKLIDETIKQSM